MADVMLTLLIRCCELLATESFRTQAAYCLSANFGVLVVA